jgi:hypothetical protein
MTSALSTRTHAELIGANPVSTAGGAASGGQLSAVFAALDIASPVVAVLLTVYLVVRLLIPAILIVYTTRDASAKQRIALLRDYLLTNTRRDHPGRRRPR